MASTSVQKEETIDSSSNEQFRYYGDSLAIVQNDFRKAKRERMSASNLTNLHLRSHLQLSFRHCATSPREGSGYFLILFLLSSIPSQR